MTGDIHVVTTRDVDELLEHNAGSFNGQEKHTRHGDLSRVASIPMPKLMELQRLGILEDDKAYRAWLNDPANRKFRTRPCRV